MEITIKALTPELATTFVDYLGSLDFGHAPHWATCFCRFYHSNSAYQDWFARTGDMNRAEAIGEIEKGNMKGYLAFDGDTCVGWCNANDARAYVRLSEFVTPLIGEKKVGCVICFVIHPQYRNQGIARKLLRYAIEGFMTDGFEAVLALPVEQVEAPEKLYRGTYNMYYEQGFEELDHREDLHVMWLTL